jgi:glycosyltransferase involved in cell wall biosynthesis
MTISVAFFSFIEGITPINYLRVFSPLQAAGIEIIHGITEKQVHLNEIARADLILFQREFPKNLSIYQSILHEAKKQNRPVVYDLDDLLISLPENHPDRISNYFAQSLLPMLRAISEADYISVPTNKLKENLLPFNKNIIVLPNFLDEKLWKIKEPSRKQPGTPLTIGYMGTNSHSPDLEGISPALLELAQSYPDQIRYRFYGAKPPDTLLQLAQMNWTPIKTYQYREFVEDFQSIDFDIFIAPLGDSLFNQCKSPLKFFEYSAQGAAGVYWDKPPYLDVVTNEVDGLLASTPQEWVSQLTRLIENEDLRYKIAFNAQQTLKNKWLLGSRANLWLETYSKILQTPINSNQTSILHHEFFQSLTEQLEEYHSKQSGMISSLAMQNEKLNQSNKQYQVLISEKETNISAKEKVISEKDKIISSLNRRLSLAENEILSYSLSLSWKITRPLRKLKNILSGRKHV